MTEMNTYIQRERTVCIDIAASILIFSFLFCKSEFFFRMAILQNHGILKSRSILSVFTIESSSKCEREPNECQNPESAPIRACCQFQVLEKFRGFLLHERYLSPVEVFFPLYFVVHILFIRSLYLLQMYSAGSEMVQMEHLHKFTEANLTIMNKYENYPTLLWFLQKNIINYPTGRHFGK